MSLDEAPKTTRASRPRRGGRRRLTGRMGAAALAALASSGAAWAGPVDTAETAPGPLAPLSGTLTRPTDGHGGPAALILPGSGPTDRDGNNPYGIKAGTYRLLAAALAEAGVTTLRIDKRGLFGSAAAIRNAYDVTVADYADDAVTWAGRLRTLTGRPCVWLIGHSEGALIALAAAARPGAGYCGLVLLASPGRPIGDILRWQYGNAGAPPALTDGLDAALKQLEAGEAVDPNDLPHALRPLLSTAVQPFLIDALTYDPPALLARTDRPTLVVRAATDLQIPPEDADRLQAAGRHVDVATIPGANHMFKQAPADDRAANLAAYGDPDLPLAPGLAETVASFLARHDPGP